MRQGMQGASRSWKREGNRFFPRASEGRDPANILIKAQRNQFETFVLRSAREYNNKELIRVSSHNSRVS